MNKQNNQKSITSNEVSGIGSPITAWAVEIEGKIYTSDIYPTRSTARYVRNTEVRSGFVKKATVRKLQLIPVKGR